VTEQYHMLPRIVTSTGWREQEFKWFNTQLMCNFPTRVQKFLFLWRQPCRFEWHWTP